MASISLKDVAAQAGVSFQTVSKVLKGKGSVSLETRTRILKIAEQLGYVPDAVARSLVSQRTGTIGIVASDFSDYVLAQLVVGAEREARRQGQCVIVGSIDEVGSDGERYIRVLMERRVDGILLAAPQLELNTQVSEMLRDRLPVVSMHYIPGESIVKVGSYQSHIGFVATQHLLEQGHRCIGTIVGPSSRRITRSRLRGYQRALNAMNVEFSPDYVEEGDWQVDSGYAAAQRLLKRLPSLTAIFAQNDTMAIGVLSALHDQGRRIPEDCAVVGCDDIPIAAYTIPALTTIHLPFYENGEVAMQVLLKIIANEPIELERISLPVHLVHRAST